MLDDEDTTHSLVKRRRTTILSKSVVNGNQSATLIASTLTNESETQSYLATSLYSNIDGYHISENIPDEDDDYYSLRYHYSSNSYEAFKIFELFVKKLNNTKYLQYILSNWVIGNRLIIKYTNRTETKDPICALASVFRVNNRIIIDCITFYFIFLLVILT